MPPALRSYGKQLGLTTVKSDACRAGNGEVSHVDIKAALLSGAQMSVLRNRKLATHIEDKITKCDVDHVDLNFRRKAGTNVALCKGGQQASGICGKHRLQVKTGAGG